MPKKEHEPDKERDEIIEDPKKFQDYHNKEADDKDKIADKFDAIHQRFQESLHPEVPKEIEEKIDALGERYVDLKRKISEVRKEGKDPLIAEFVLRPFQSKLKFASVTQDRRDFETAELILKEAQTELDDAIAFEEPNVKAEVEAMVKGDS